MKSEQINELGAALAKAQGEIVGAIKDSSNPHYKSRYADLSSVWEACRHALSKHGLCVSQLVEQTENGDVLCTMLIHSSGQWLSSIMPIRIKSDGRANELQTLGSIMTYLRRFSLAAIVGVAPADDDDGNSATGYQVSAQKSPPPQNTQIAPKLITPEQANDFRALISRCSPEFKKNVDNLLKERNINGFHEMGEVLYKNLASKAIEDMKNFQALTTKEEPVAI